MTVEAKKILFPLAVAGAAVATTAWGIDHNAVNTLFSAVFNGDHLANAWIFHNPAELFGAHHSAQAFTVDQAQQLHSFNQNLNYNYYSDTDTASAIAFGIGSLSTLPFGLSRLFHRRHSEKPGSSSAGAPKDVLV